MSHIQLSAVMLMCLNKNHLKKTEIIEIKEKRLSKKKNLSHQGNEISTGNSWPNDLSAVSS